MTSGPSGLLDRFVELSEDPKVLAQARKRTAGYNLPSHLAEDVRQAALTSVFRALTAGKLQDDQHLEKLLARALRSAAVDLVRGRIRRPVGEPVRHDDEDDAWDSVPEAEGPPAWTIEEHVAATIAQSLRAAIVATAARASGFPGIPAAALAVVAFGQSADLADPAGAPRPSGKGDQRRWSALWLAGHRCFGPPDPPAQRQQRSRLLKKLDDFLRTAADEAGVTP